jgi:hypothetical protein
VESGKWATMAAEHQLGHASCALSGITYGDGLWLTNQTILNWQDGIAQATQCIITVSHCIVVNNQFCVPSEAQTEHFCLAIEELNQFLLVNSEER